MPNILDRQGNIVGTLDVPASGSAHPAVEILAAFLASRSGDSARTERRERRRAAVRRAGRWIAFGLAVLFVLAWWNDRGTQMEARADRELSQSRPFNIPRDAWYGAEVDRYGVIRINGEVAGSVNDGTGKALRDAFLVSAGDGAAAELVDDGLKYCRLLASGDADALKARTDLGDRVVYGTDARSLRVASAAINHFCPKYAN